MAATNAGGWSSGKSQGRNARIASGISGQVVSITLIAFPINVATDGGSPRNCGFRNFQLQHHDGKQRQQHQRRRLPHVRRFAGNGIGGNPARERRVDALRLESVDEIFDSP